MNLHTHTQVYGGGGGSCGGRGLKGRKEGRKKTVRKKLKNLRVRDEGKAGEVGLLLLLGGGVDAVFRFCLEVRLGDILGIGFIDDVGFERGFEILSCEEIEVDNSEEFGIFNLRDALGTEAVTGIFSKEVPENRFRTVGEVGRERRFAVDDPVEHKLSILFIKRRPEPHHLVQEDPKRPPIHRCPVFLTLQQLRGNVFRRPKIRKSEHQKIEKKKSSKFCQKKSTRMISGRTRRRSLIVRRRRR